MAAVMRAARRTRMAGNAVEPQAIASVELGWRPGWPRRLAL